MYGRTVTDYLDRSVERFPNKIAVQDSKRSLSFMEVQKEAMQLASFLSSKKLFKKPIAIFLEKSTECFSSIFGVAYSGNYYTIIDVKMPAERIQRILNILSPEMIITDEAHKKLPDSFTGNFKTVTIEEIHATEAKFEKIKEIEKHIIDTDILYVLFTSGSTGDPKGVIISHRNVICYMEWSKKAFHFDQNTVFGNQTPFYFSMSVLDIFQTVCVGARLVLIPPQKFIMPGELLNLIEKEQINTLYWVPSALCLLANLGALDKDKLKSIEKVLFAGEVMPAKQLNMWRRALPNVIYANLYGPTEATDICTYYIIDREIEDDETIPIGRSAENMDSFIIKDNGTLAEGMEEGELLVRGSSLAYGYYNNPKKTEEAFVQNPLQSAYREIVYRTGDLVHYNERGELIFISRKDFQIKFMGYRIELGEIEAAASSLIQVDRVCCVYDTEKSEIVLFYTGKMEGSQVEGALRNKLPNYMLPRRYIKLVSMPLNLNGKIDRKQLEQQLYMRSSG